MTSTADVASGLAAETGATDTTQLEAIVYDEHGLPGAFPPGTELPIADPRFEAARRFLLREATLLDSGRQREWLTMLHPSLRYRVPVRVTRWRVEGPGFTESMHMDETHGSLKGRVVARR